MTGFFAVRVDAVTLPALRSAGYPILVEIMATSGLSTVAAVPCAFRPRFAGKSKASLREGCCSCGTCWCSGPRWAGWGSAQAS